jgi:hypothetical protein
MIFMMRGMNHGERHSAGHHPNASRHEDLIHETGSSSTHSPSGGPGQDRSL